MARRPHILPLRHTARAALCALMFLHPGIGAVASPGQTVSSALGGAYDGAGRRPLATSKSGAIHEEDLLLWSLVSGKSNPALYGEYVRETNHQRKAELALELKQRIAECLYVQDAALREAPAGQTKFEQLQARSLEHAVAAFVWIHHVILPEIRITPGDERNYYLNHLEEFVTPRRAEIRHIFRRVPPDSSEDHLLEQSRFLFMLRGMLETHPDGFENAARAYSEAPSAEEGGRIPPFEEGEFFPEFEEAVFSLRLPGDMTQPFRGPDGLYLAQLIEITPRNVKPLEEAREEVRIHLLAEMAGAHFTYQVQRLRSNARIESRFPFWKSLGDEDRIARIGDFEITKGDFWRLHPAIIAPDGSLDETELNRRAQRFIEFELIRRDLERKGVGGHPQIARGRQWASAVIAARRAETRYVDEQIRIAGPEVGPAPIRPTDQALERPRSRLFRVWGEIRDPRMRDAQTLARLRERLPFALQEHFNNAQAGIGGETAATQWTGDAPEAVRAIKSQSDEEFMFHWLDMGYVELRTMPELESLLRGVRVGRFSPVEQEGDRAVGYFLAAEGTVSAEVRDYRGLQQEKLSASQRRALIADAYRTAVIQGLGIAYAE